MACCAPSRGALYEITPSPDSGLWISIDGITSATHTRSFSENDITAIGDNARAYCAGLPDESLSLNMNMCLNSASHAILTEMFYNNSNAAYIRFRYEKGSGKPLFVCRVIPTSNTTNVNIGENITSDIELRIDGGTSLLYQE